MTTTRQSRYNNAMFSRFKSAIVAVALLLSFSALGSCAPPPGLGGPSTDGGPSKNKEKVEVAVELGESADSHFERARDQLREDYASFLEREPLGFDATTFDEIGPELALAWERATRAVEGTGGRGVQTALPFVLIGLLLLLLVVMDRQAWRMAMLLQARAHTVAFDWLQLWTRVLLVVLGRALPVAVLVGLSYFPVQAVFDREAWSRGLTVLLWVFLGYRSLLAFAHAALAFELVDVPDEDAWKLEAFARRALRLVFGMLALVALARRLEFAPDVQALIIFSTEVVLVAVPLYLLAIKPSVMALLPKAETSGFARFVAAVDRYFLLIVLLSTLLLVLRASGYVNASTFILLRGYGLFVLIVTVFAGGSRFRKWLRQRGGGAESRRDLYQSIDWTLRIVSIFVVTYVGLRLLHGWEPLITVLRIPLLSVGGATISPHSITKAGILFLGAVLFARFVRAILVIRVFPAFDIDVGVGYAVQTLVNYALIVIGFFIALVALGVNLSAMTVVVASLGVGIGFGLQTLTENLISGFILLFGRSVKKGDIITVSDTYGQVEAVGARSVLIRTPDNYDMLIPSKEIVGGRIVNWSYNDTFIRHRLPVGVTYKADPREVESALLEAASRHEMVLRDPAPEVWLKEFGDSAVKYTLLIYFDCRKITRGRLNGEINFIVWDVLAERGIEIPFPQRDLHFKSANFPLTAPSDESE